MAIFIMPKQNLKFDFIKSQIKANVYIQQKSSCIKINFTWIMWE